MKPFWLSLSEKDNVSSLETLTNALLAPQLSPEYRSAIAKALASPYSRIIPFFGSFLKELRAILKGIPSLVVLSSEENSKLEVSYYVYPIYRKKDVFEIMLNFINKLNVCTKALLLYIIETIIRYSTRRKQKLDHNSNRTLLQAIQNKTLINTFIQNLLL